MSFIFRSSSGVKDVLGNFDVEGLTSKMSFALSGEMSLFIEVAPLRSLFRCRRKRVLSAKVTRRDCGLRSLNLETLEMRLRSLGVGFASDKDLLLGLIMETIKKRKGSEGEAITTHSPIADPIADKSLAKKIIKLATKCEVHIVSEEKMCRRGVKEVVKALRKNKRGLIVLAADILPIELISHIPIMCEDRGIPYIYVESKDFLGQAALSKRATTVLMLSRPQSGHELREEYKALFDQVKEKNPYLK